MRHRGTEYQSTLISSIYLPRVRSATWRRSVQMALMEDHPKDRQLVFGEGGIRGVFAIVELACWLLLVGDGVSRRKERSWVCLTGSYRTRSSSE